jgi:hypothetical protein
MFLRHFLNTHNNFLNDLEMLPVALIITDITFVFTFHMNCFYCKVFTFYNLLFLATFLSPVLAYVFLFVVIVIVIITVLVVVVVVTVIITVVTAFVVII